MSLTELSKNTNWMASAENRRQYQLILKKSREKYYQFEPYYNRTDGEPSWQWRFLKAAGKYRARISLGGNRIGKSMMGAYECWLAITGRHPFRKFPQNGKCWICATDFGKMRDINLPKFEMFMPSNYKLESHYGKQDRIWWIRGEGREWKVQFKSAEAGRRAFEGDDIDIMWFDEEMPQEIYTECMMRLIDRRGIWFMTATPVLGTAWLKAKTEDKENIFTTFGSMWNNPYLSEEEIKEKAAEMTEEEKLVRIEGKYLIFGGRPVFNVLQLTKLIDELKDREKHPLGIRGVITEAA